MEAKTFMKFGVSFYSVMDLPEKQLDLFLKEVTREELIEWLSWNDRNGVYEDGQSLKEFGSLMTKEEGKLIMKRQIMNSR